MPSAEATTLSLSLSGILFLLNVVSTDLLSQDRLTLGKMSEASKRSDDAVEGFLENQDQRNSRRSMRNILVRLFTSS